MNYKKCTKVVFFSLFFILFSSHNLFAEDFISNQNMFYSEIINVSKDENNDYFIEFKIESLLQEELVFNINLIYPLENLTMNIDTINCKSSCVKKIKIDKVFFGKYYLNLDLNINQTQYQKKLDFEIIPPNNAYDIFLEPTYFISNGQINIIGNIVLNTFGSSVFEFEIFPKSAPNEKKLFKITCESKCSFEHIVNSPVILDDYVIRIYSMQGDMEKVFKTVYDILPKDKNNEKERKEEKIEIKSETKIEDKKIIENTQNKKEDSFKLYHKKNNGKNISGYFLYDNIGKKGDEIKTKIKKNNLELLPIEVSTQDTYDVEFEFNETSKVRSIKIPNTKIENLSIGVEDVKPNGIIGVPQSITSAFAINPSLPTPISFFEVNFTATGTTLYKCELYNFTTKSCYGSYKKLLDTIPGQTYILNLTGVDPLFVNTVANTSNDGRAAGGVFQLNTAPVRFGNVAGVLYDAYFRFDKVAVPPGSQVTNAYLNLTSAAARSGVTTNGKIHGFKEVNCMYFDAANGGDNPVDNTRTTNYVLWNAVPAWSNAENGPDTNSPNLSLVIQEIIDMSSWEYNNSICIVVLNNASSNNAYRDIQTVGATPAKLYVNYTNPSAFLKWIPVALNLSTYTGQSQSSIVNITSIMNNTNITITEVGGTGSSFISINTSNLGNKTDTQKSQVLFDCSPLSSEAIGSYESIFNVRSTESSSGTNITITCNVQYGPQLNLIYPSNTNYVNVSDGENLILRFNLTDQNGNLISNYTDVLNITIGNISLNITSYSNLTFVSNFSIASQMTTPQGMTMYGNKIWITSGDRDSVYEYYTNGTYITYYNISGQTTDPRGITTLDGSEFWVVDNGAVAPNDVVIHYSSNFIFINSFSVATQTVNPYGITYDGITFYVEDDTTDRILRYNSSGVYQSTFSIAAQTTTPRGVEVYGNELWVVDDAGTAPNDLLLHYYTNGTYIDAFSVAAQSTLPIGISTIDGKQFFVADTSLDRVLFYRAQNTRYNSSGFFEVNVTMPTGLANFQNLSMNVLTYPNSEFIVTDLEINALNFGEKIPPSSVSNLQNISRRATWIYFNWTNPIDSDYSYAQIWYNNSNIANVSSPLNYYNLTFLLPNTNYTISIRTVDTNGNVNTTFVNKSAFTSGYPIIQNITPVLGTAFYQNSNVTISANVTDTTGIYSVRAYILWDSGAQTLNMTDVNGDNIYEVNFTNTVDFATYNVTITAINNLADSTINITDFDIVTNTPFLDSYVRSDTAATSYGAATRIHVSSVSTSLRRGLLRFDLSYLPTGIRIDNAMMQLYLATYSGTAITHSIFAINSTWNSTTNWNTQPTTLSTNWNSTRVSAAATWYYFNITNLSKNWYNGSITNNGLMVKEAVEVTTGTNQYRSAEAGTLIPALVINYTDITNPQVTSISSVQNTYHLKDNVSLKVLVTDNIGVSSVYANISYLQGSQRVNLTLTSTFTYEGNFSNSIYQGNYNITIIANDTSNLINNSLKYYFNVTSLNLKLIENITKLTNSNFNINLTLQNINDFKTFENTSIKVHIFIPSNLTLNSNFNILASTQYSTSNSSQILSDPIYNGIIYKFTLIPQISSGSVFESYTTSFNQTNSWNLNFNLTGFGNYNISKVIFSVE